MYDKNTILKESKRDIMWAELRQSYSRLNKIILTGDMIQDDFILLYSCLQVVLIDIEIYEDYYINNLDGKDKYFFKCYQSKEETSFDDYYADVLDRIIHLSKISNTENKSEEKQCLLEEIRINLWLQMIIKKDDIREVFDVFPSLSIDRLHILFQCVSMVVFEFLAKNIEIKIIEGEI